MMLTMRFTSLLKTVKQIHRWSDNFFEGRKKNEKNSIFTVLQLIFIFVNFSFNFSTSSQFLDFLFHWTFWFHILCFCSLNFLFQFLNTFIKFINLHFDFEFFSNFWNCSLFQLFIFHLFFSTFLSSPFNLSY